MPTNYPTALDTTTNLPTTIADATSQATNHPAYHNTEDGALIALETKLGIGASTPTNGLVLTGGVTPGTSAWAVVGATTNNTTRTFESFGGTLTNSAANQLTAWTAAQAFLVANPGYRISFGPGTYQNMPNMEFPYFTGMVGAGILATRLQAVSTMSVSPWIKNHVSTGSGDPNGTAIWISDMYLDMRLTDSANIGVTHRTAAGTIDAIFFTTNPTISRQTGDPAYFASDIDMHHVFTNVLVQSAPRDSFSALGRGESTLTNCQSIGPGRYGFQWTFDSRLISCMSSFAGSEGFYITKPPAVLIGCTSFYSGNIVPGNGYGFRIVSLNQNGVAMTGCQAQDNKGYGLQVDASVGPVIIESFVCDSNSVNATGPGIRFFNADNVILSAICSDRNINATPSQLTGILLVSGSNNNKIKLVHVPVNGSTVNTPIDPTSDFTTCLSNEISVNQYGSRQSIASAATVTPNPTNGNIIQITMGGNITTFNVPAAGNAWPGAEMTFEFLQDGTGGRTLAGASASYKPAPNAAAVVTAAGAAAATWTTTLNTRTILTYTCVDGTVWRQKGVGVTGQA